MNIQILQNLTETSNGGLYSDYCWITMSMVKYIKYTCYWLQIGNIKTMLVC